MPTALDRLVASPSALRALRFIVNGPGFPALWIPAHNCCHIRSRGRRWDSTLAKGESLSFKGEKQLDAKFSHDGTPWTISNIEYEAAVNRRDSGQRRVDNPDEPNKSLLWAQLLHYQYRVYGHEGVRYIWMGMKRRKFTIPTDTKEGSLFWGTLIRHRGIAKHVLAYAAEIYKNTGSIYPGLYEECIAYWLPRLPRLAYQCHEYMVDKLHLTKLPLRNLAPLALKNPKARMTFKDIYQSSNERDIYSSVVPVLCDNGEVGAARQWHRICIEHKDFPPHEAKSHDMVRRFIKEDTLLLAPLVEHRPSADMQSTVKVFRFGDDRARPDRYRKYNIALMERLTAREVENIPYDDAFCARLFATKMFPISSIIRGLRLIGVSEIGPQALREMALRAEPINELDWFYKQLEEAEVSIRSCVFTLAMEKFTKEKNFTLVRSLLESDQHPEVLEDPDTQTKLLDYYIVQEDWMQVHRTLAILTFFHDDVKTGAWNLLLQSRLRLVDPSGIHQVLNDMRENSIDLEQDSISSVLGMLRLRQSGRRPVTVKKAKLDDLRFVAQTLIKILESGVGYVHPWKWREILRRYGMLGRLRELRRLIHWLAQWYAHREDPRFAHLPRSPFLDAATRKLRSTYTSPHLYFNLYPGIPVTSPIHPFRQLFPKSFIQAVMVWGFRAGLVPNSPWEQSLFSGNGAKRWYKKRFIRKGILKRAHWTVGVQMLAELRDMGVHVNPRTLKKACNRQFAVLWDTRSRSNKIANRIMRQENKLPYHVWVMEINRAWGSTLIPEPWVKPIVPRKDGLESEEHPDASGALVAPEAQPNQGPLQALKKALRQLETAHFKQAAAMAGKQDGLTDVLNEASRLNDGLLQALTHVEQWEEERKGGRYNKGRKYRKRKIAPPLDAGLNDSIEPDDAPIGDGLQALMQMAQLEEDRRRKR